MKKVVIFILSGRKVEISMLKFFIQKKISKMKGKLKIKNKRKNV